MESEILTKSVKRKKNVKKQCFKSINTKNAKSFFLNKFYKQLIENGSTGSLFV